MPLTSIATLGSHCAMQVLKGAKDEGFNTVLVCEKKRESLYRRFKFIDEFILVDSFTEVADDACQKKLLESESILIPHGTLISQLDSDSIESMRVPVFGNKMILRWESDRKLKEQLMRSANLNLPRTIEKPSDIGDSTVIVKRQGAAGGKGYFMASSADEYEKKRSHLVRQKIISESEELYIQEYIQGVLAYLQFFNSPLEGRIEFFGADQRHESDIEGLGRIPAHIQSSEKVSSFNVIGNTPIVLRESLLEEAYNMADRFAAACKESVSPGMNGPFCIEGTYDENAKFTAFEFSGRIVAGTNIYMDGSPYYGLLYGESISMGRRIAREIKRADAENMTSQITT